MSFFWTQRKSHDDVVGDPVVPTAPAVPELTLRTWKLIRQCTQQFRLAGFRGNQASRLGYMAALQIDGWGTEAAKAEGLRVFPREGT